MAQFDYYLFDAGAQLVDTGAAAHDDLLDAFERMHALLGQDAAIARIELWQEENFVARIDRSDGRLALKSRIDPPPAHPLHAARQPATKAS